MSNSRGILITGVTGNLGSELLKLILLDANERNVKLFLLVRARNKNFVENRINDLFRSLFKSKYKLFLKFDIKILNGDVSQKKIGLSNKDYESLIQHVDIIYHSAALTRFQDPLPKQIITNVTGTKRMLDIMMCGKKMIELHYISTIFVAGTFKGRFSEDDLNVGQNFNNPYEQSKFEAERIVRQFLQRDRKVCIYRPSIIVGGYETGSIINFQMFYQALYLISKGIIERIPVNKNAKIHIIPVDIAARMIFILSKYKNDIMNKNSTYHIICPNELNIKSISEIVANYFNIESPKLSVAFNNEENKTTNNKSYYQFLQSMTSYLQFNAKVECQKTLGILRSSGFLPPAVNEQYVKRLLKYAVKCGYIKT